VSQARRVHPAALSAYWFALEAHWAALLGAAAQGQIARFTDPSFVGHASSILFGFGAALSIISQYVAGRASDRLRRRMPFMIAGTVCDIAALFCFALAPSFLSVVVAFCAVQISLNIAGGPYQALIPDRVAPEHQGRASAFMGLFRLAGNAGGLLLARVFVRQPGPTVSVAAFEHGLILLAATISALLLIGLLITLLAAGEVAPRSDDRSAAAGKASVEEPWLYRRSFVILTVSRSFVNLGLYSILPFFAFYLRNAIQVATYLPTSVDLLLVMVGCSLVGTLPAGIASDRFSKKSIMYGALAALAIGALGLTLATNLQVVTVVAIPIGIGWGAYYSVDWALACNLLPRARAGALMALWNIGASAPQVLAPLVGGYIVDSRAASAFGPGEGYRVLFALVSAYVILGAVALAFVREPLRDSEGMAPRPR
jgi:MFS family permease